MPRDLIFLTGATGVLGQDLIKELLRAPDCELALLSRSKNKASHSERIQKIFKGSKLASLLGSRIRVIEGDVTQPGFGMSRGDREFLKKHTTVFYHIAAHTVLNGTRDDCDRINVKGTEHALELAWDFKKGGKLERFIYFGTAFVAGSLQTYHSKEDELPKKPAHANYYESSKYAAEKKVREAMAKGLPVTIIRPSIVVGHSETGEVSEFNVIYPFMKLFAHGALSKLPTRLENTFNIVPIDFVIQATSAIAQNPKTIGRTYHLTAPKPPSIGMLLKVKDEKYPNIPPVEVINPDKFEKTDLDVNEQFVYSMLEPYLGYLNGKLTFDTTNTQAILSGTKVRFPKTDIAFLKTLVAYAVQEGYLIVK